MHDVPDLHREKARRLSRLAAGGVGVVAIGVVAWRLVGAHSQASALHEVAITWSAFEHCLIGTPLADGELLSTRLELIAAGNRPPDVADPWPTRCFAPLDAVKAALADAHESSPDGFVQLTIELEGLQRELAQQDPDERWNPFENPFSTVDGLHLPRVASTGRPPPIAATPFTTLMPLGHYELHVHGSLVVLWGTGETCSIAVRAADATCTAIGDISSIETIVPPADDGVPAFAIAGLAERRAVRRLADGATIASHYFGEDNIVSAGDSMAMLVEGPPAKLVRWAAGVSTETKLAIPKDAWPRLHRDLAFWQAGKPTHLFAQRVGIRGDAPGPVLDLGEGGSSLGGELCVADDTTVFVEGFGRAHAWFIDRDSAHAIADPPQASNETVITCGHDRVTFTWITDADVIHQVACTRDGCGAEHVAHPLRKDTYRVLSARAAEVGDQTLAIYGDDQGMWMRLAPFDKLDTAREVLIGPISIVHDIFVDGTTALVLLDTSTELGAVRVEPNGTVTPIERSR